MIIWLNGAFGSGKTTVASKLHQEILNSFIYDPEDIGGFLWHIFPPELVNDDFQDYVEWRSINFEILRKLDADYDGIIIVPMTITNKMYFDEIVGNLRQIGVRVSHFILTASQSTLEKRLTQRGEVKGSWGFNKIAECIAVFDEEWIGEKIDTNTKTVNQITRLIFEKIPK